MERQFKLIFYWFLAIIGLVLMFALIRGYLYVPSVLDLGIYNLRLYGLVFAGAILSGYGIARKFAWKFGISQEEIDKLTFWLVVVSLVGARVYYVLSQWYYYQDNLGEVVKIWHGGISIYGALISGIIYLLIISRKRAYSFFQITDLIALALPLSQAVGRLANFVNQEAYGKPTDLPWGLYIDPPMRPYEYYNLDYFHPTFLYEALWNVIIFMVLYYLVPKNKQGYLTSIYLMFYSFGRFFIEWIRLDSSFIFGFKLDMVVSVLIFGFSLIMFYQIKSKNSEKSPQD
jgi:phosphatidylglycerol:prolipoprotein diacylglycerol transferase